MKKDKKNKTFSFIKNVLIIIGIIMGALVLLEILLGFALSGM
jgi:small-conductance mechanosensitive channel